MIAALFMEDEPEIEAVRGVEPEAAKEEELFAVHFRAGEAFQDFFVIDYNPKRLGGPVHWGTGRDAPMRKAWPRAKAEEVMAVVLRDYMTPSGSRYDRGYTDLRLVPHGPALSAGTRAEA